MAKTWKQPKCPSTDEWIKKMWCIYTMEYYSAIKKNEIMPFAATWMDLEIIILSEVKSERERQIPYDIPYMWNLKQDTNELFYKTETDSQTQKANLWLPKGKGGWGRDKLGVGNQQIQTTIYEIDKQHGSTVQHRELYSISYNKP